MWKNPDEELRHLERQFQIDEDFQTFRQLLLARQRGGFSTSLDALLRVDLQKLETMLHSKGYHQEDYRGRRESGSYQIWGNSRMVGRGLSLSLPTTDPIPPYIDVINCEISSNYYVSGAFLHPQTVENYALRIIFTYNHAFQSFVEGDPTIKIFSHFDLSHDTYYEWKEALEQYFPYQVEIPEKAIQQKIKHDEAKARWRARISARQQEEKERGPSRYRLNPDEELRALERELASDPENEELAFRYRQLQFRNGAIRGVACLWCQGRGGISLYSFEPDNLSFEPDNLSKCYHCSGHGLRTRDQNLRDTELNQRRRQQMEDYFGPGGHLESGYRLSMQGYNFTEDRLKEERRLLDRAEDKPNFEDYNARMFDLW